MASIYGALSMSPIVPPDLCDDKVVVILLPQQFYIAFYLVGDVRNYLYGFAKISRHVVPCR